MADVPIGAPQSEASGSVASESTAPPVVATTTTTTTQLDWSVCGQIGFSAPGEYAVETLTQLSSVTRASLHKSSNFLKSVKWSPDGTCVLTTSEDNIARLLELSSDMQPPISMRTAVRVREGETIYDSAWYPLMNSTLPETCFFATCARAHPVHLWDAFTGNLVTSFTALNAVSELDAALSLAFSNDGSALYVTYPQRLCTFHTQRPGAESVVVPLKATLPGLLACIAVAPPSSIAADTLLAIGSYSGRIGLVSTQGELTATIAAQPPGVTHMSFSADGSLLFASGRKHALILGWDMRKLDAPLFSFPRPLTTHQRLSFALHPTAKVLMTGGEDGQLRCFDTAGTGEQLASYPIHNSCVNSVSIHPWLPLVALGTGSRRFALEDEDEDEDDDEQQAARKELLLQEERVQLWRIGA